MYVAQAVTRAVKSRIVHTQVFGVLILLTLLFTSEGWQGKHIILEESLYLAGVLLVALCVVGRTWSLSYISGNKRKSLVTSGPYSLCRNPLYLSNCLGAIGLALCTETITITVAVAVAFALYYPGVIRKEEMRLNKLFGHEFVSYRESVPAFLPTLKDFTERETMVVAVRPFRNGLRDLAFFILGVGLIEFVEALHKAGVLPTLLRLY